MNASLSSRWLLYERVTRCLQELCIGPPRAPRRDRTILRLASTVSRDPGYQRGYTHAYNDASLCRHRASGPGGGLRLGATALAGATAYVTEVPTAAPGRTRIITVATGGAR